MQFDKIKKGTVLSSTLYMEVLSKGTDSIRVKDSFGKEFEVRGKELIEQLNANDQYDKEETVSKTKAAEILVGAGDTVFTVDYVKADGKDRTLVGHLLQTENLLGRSDVRDLLITKDNPLRQVDHRTIKSIVLKGVKYNVKK